MCTFGVLGLSCETPGGPTVQGPTLRGPTLLGLNFSGSGPPHSGLLAAVVV